MPPRKKVTEPTPLEVVAQLMGERQKYEKWLRDLEAKKDSTPPHVYDRVRGDYNARLDEVMSSLREHTNAMQEHARTLMVRLKELEVSEEELRDELSENELRAQVGELTPGEWEISKKKADRLLAKFKEDQELVADDLNRIREILSGAPVQVEARHSTDFDELEFLKSVVGPSTPAASSTPADAPKRVANAEARTEQPKAVADAPTPPAPPAPKAEPVAEKPVEKAAAPPAEAPAAAPRPKPQVHETPATALRNSGITEVPKTLKCSECGAMNYPSEWYCERCGAELTVV